MTLDLETAARRALLGESLASIIGEYRGGLLESVGLTDADATPDTFRKETSRFAGRLCRHLAERRGGDPRVSAALHEFVQAVDDYEPFDALLATFKRFEGREAVLRRGKALFPRTLTAHWDER